MRMISPTPADMYVSVSIHPFIPSERHSYTFCGYKLPIRVECAQRAEVQSTPTRGGKFEECWGIEMIVPAAKISTSTRVARA